MVISLISKDECFEKGLLQKEQPSLDLARKSIRQANFFLSEAHDLFDIKKELIAIISLYNAYFHAARAILFRDGIKERSHYCIARYLEEEYINKNLINKKFLNAFETAMSLRHNIQYSTEKIEIEENLTELYNLCEEFILEIEKVIKE